VIFQKTKRRYLLTAVALVVAASLVHLFLNNRNNGQLVWPEVGQAAIGSVEDGLLARSPGIEKARPIASMAKVITALAIMEKKPFKPGQAGQVYTINKKDITGLRTYISDGCTVLPIHTGMNITQYQAMQRMLIASDNIMADILVERTFGSKAAYLRYTKVMLKRMGLSRTVVADASGFNPGTMSTPSEVVAIGIAALKNPVIAKIVALQRADLPVTGTIKNTNQLLGLHGIIGIKTGTTYKAGSCLLFAARYTSSGDGQKKTIVGVIMGNINHSTLYRDSKNLLASAKLCFAKDEGHTTFNFVSPSAKETVLLVAK
jgi:D-alanyl-D-alanine carboxypeptidase (penicillin-binding protein 5/6)